MPPVSPSPSKARLTRGCAFAFAFARASRYGLVPAGTGTVEAAGAEPAATCSPMAPTLSAPFA